MSASPYYDPGFGEYGWSRSIGACVPLFVNHRLYVLLQALHSLIPLSIIAITSTWTFAFTRGYLEMNLNRQKTMVTTASFVEQKHIYSVQVLNLIGIFGSLFLFNFLSWIPFLLISAVGSGIGFRNIPSPVYVASYILFHFSNVSNPIIQSYFRKELTESLKGIFCKWKVVRTVSSIRGRSRNVNISGTSHVNNSVEQIEDKNVNVKTSSMAWECASVQTILDNLSEDCTSKTEETVEQVENMPQESPECSTVENATNGCIEMDMNSAGITPSPLATLEA